mgnify:CR=1 FL=1
MDINVFKAMFSDGTIRIESRGHFSAEPGVFTLSRINRTVRHQFRSALVDLQMSYNSEARHLARTAPGSEPDLMKVINSYGFRVTCPECGERVKLELRDGVLVPETECAFPGGLRKYSASLNVPSGRIVFANDLRALVDLDPGRQYADIGTSVGTREYTGIHAEKGLILMSAGNTSPDIIQHQDGSVSVVSLAFDQNTDEFVVPVGDTIVGDISTSLWWFSAMDHDAFLAACRRTNLAPETFDASIVTVDPGLWEFTSLFNLINSNPDDFDDTAEERAEERAEDGDGDEEERLGILPATVIASAKRIGSALPVVAHDNSEPSQITDTHFWKTWLAASEEQPARSYIDEFLCSTLCGRGHGYSWRHGKPSKQSGYADTGYLRSEKRKLADVAEADGLFNRIPPLSPGLMLRNINADIAREALRRKYTGAPAKIRKLDGSYGIFDMPLHVDVHWLAAAMVLYRTLLDEPQHLCDETATFHMEQHHLVSRGLDLLCEIASRRELWGRLDGLFPEMKDAIEGEIERRATQAA